MLTAKQVNEIREHLEKSQNPLFFFDNDQDGACSFLLLKRAYERGIGVAVKTPLGVDYFRKVKEFNPDYIFILDVPNVLNDFFEEVKKINIPIIWIDHHDIEKIEIPEFIYYYNPFFNSNKTNEPVTALCSQINEKKQDYWIGVIGCIADKFIPEFYKKFLKDYPELGIESNNAFDIFYKSEIGKISQIIGACLKDKTTNVIKMLKFLSEAKSPYDVLEENKNNFFMHKRFNEINSKLKKLIEKAKSRHFGKKILFFEYSGNMSLSADISNRLAYEFPDRVIVVSYIQGRKVNVSIRGQRIKAKVMEIVKELKNTTGGGHESAVGIQMDLDDLNLFKAKFEKINF